MRQTREYYKEKFEKQMERFYYILQDGERIVQCRDPYPPFWFISNKGYLFTAYYKDAKILNNNPTVNGLKDADGNYTGRKWHYLYGDKKDVQMQKLIAEHFLTCEFDNEENEKIEIHHIRKQKAFADDEGHLCNRADNLQLLPKSVHDNVSKYGSKTLDQIDEETEKKVLESGCPIYGMTEQQLEQFVINAIKSVPYVVVYTRNTTDDIGEIKVEAHKYTADDIQIIDDSTNE